MDVLLPLGFAIVVWWLSTVVIIYRAGLPRETFGRTLGAATVAAMVGCWLLYVSAGDATPLGAYMAFTGAVTLFGWHEVAYLFGFVSGPRPLPCPTPCSGWSRFVMGVKTCLYHELAVVSTVAILAVMTLNSPNKVGLWTLVILWLMRWSAKLNIFLGVRNLHAEFWPPHLAYLKSYTRERPMNGLFPLSIVLSSTVIALLAVVAFDSPASSAERTGTILMATLLALATLEHWFLILKLPDELLWQPGMRSRLSSPRRPASADLGSGA